MWESGFWNNGKREKSRRSRKGGVKNAWRRLRGGYNHTGFKGTSVLSSDFYTNIVNKIFQY